MLAAFDLIPVSGPAWKTVGDEIAMRKGWELGRDSSYPPGCEASCVRCPEGSVTRALGRPLQVQCQPDRRLFGLDADHLLQTPYVGSRRCQPGASLVDDLAQVWQEGRVLA